jgi:hypothetical protein
MLRKYEILLLLLFSSVIFASVDSQPVYVSRLFDVYDYAGAGVEYASSVASALEEAYSAYESFGVALAPPCSGSHYVVNVVQLAGGEGGFVKQQFTVEKGLVKGACIAWVNITKGLDEQQLKHVAYHEVAHIAQAAYYKYETVILSYPWYVEGSAEGLASALSGVCGWEPHYFSYKLYGYSPYSFSGTSAQSYALSAFYYWVVKSGYAAPRETLSNSLSGASTLSDWVNQAYTKFLIALARGLAVCGNLHSPSFIDIYLPKGSWSTDVSLEGLSAVYYKILIPAPGPILITAPSGLSSNLLLNKPFKAENTSLYLVLVNSALNTVSGTISLSYTPLFEVSVASGVFDPEHGQLEVALRLLLAGQPVEGTVYINGTVVEASSGYAHTTLSVNGWGVYTISVRYLDETAYVKVRIAYPSAELETATPLYLSSSGLGELVACVRNAGDVAIKLQANAIAPPFLQAAPLEVIAPPGESRFSLKFSVAGQVEAASGELRLNLGASSVNLPFRIVPAKLTVVEVSYDAETNVTTATALADPPGIPLTAHVPGLSGEAWFKLSTYYVGRASVSPPPPLVNLSARPLLVAPSWLLLAVNATVGTSSACPAYQTSYRVPVSINGTHLGVASLRCGGFAVLRALFNVSYGFGAAVVLAEKSGAVLEVPIPLPEIDARVIDWLLTDDGSTVKVEVDIRGSSRYVVFGREVVNATLVVEKKLPPSSELVLDTGFETFTLPMPSTSLELVAPRVASSQTPLKLALVLRTLARVDASADLLLNGEVIGLVKLSKGYGREAIYELEVQPPRPALYNVTARAWFASASASVAYVSARGLELAAPPFVLLNRTADVKVTLCADPPLKLPVNITVTGCELANFQAEANSSFKLSFARPCTLLLRASFLNLTTSSEIRWDVLSVMPKRSLGLLHGGFVVPTGLITFTAFLANGSSPSARVEIDGRPYFNASKPGSYLLRVRAEYMGQVNETLVSAFAVPEELYRRALAVHAELNDAPNLKTAIEAAVISGKWEIVAGFVETYELAKSRTRYYCPISLIAQRLAERWATIGDEEALSASRALLTCEPIAYLAITIAAVLSWKRFRSKKRNN